MYGGVMGISERIRGNHYQTVPLLRYEKYTQNKVAFMCRIHLQDNLC